MQSSPNHNNDTLESRFHFADLINEKKYRSAVEVGVFKGKFATHLLESCPELSLILVDAWDGTGVSKPYDPEAVFSKITAIKKQYGGHRVTIVRERSPGAVLHSEVKDKHFDFIYIDADHSFDAVVNDVRAWWPKVRTGGVLAGHDYNNRGSKRVKKAVDSIFEHVKVTEERCASWWIEKSS